MVPGQKAYPVIHLCQEGIDHVFTTRIYFLEEVLDGFTLADFDGAHGDLEELVLRDELEDLHLLVQVELPILVPQDTVQQLVEVNESVLRFYTHLQHLLVQLRLAQIRVAQRRRDGFEQPRQLACVEFLAARVLGKFDPGCDDNLIVAIEELEGTCLVQIQLLELLDDNQNEQVEHHLRHEQNHGDEEKWTVAVAARQARLAVG
mmetsp:Transcript_13085/g.17711  ORF Transcript_13085/g.17711 Transcript_13085/m.17711 type:complete len:204 (+) Transcript_13085:836-1447(+)